jgi:pyridoxamine 5'-phosphate oxidase
MSPIAHFNTYYAAELKHYKSRVPGACCLSTNGLDGYPNARYVALKEVVAETFIVAGPLNTRKGLEIAQSNKVALTFWWPHSGVQVRIQGNVSIASGDTSQTYFAERSRQSQIVSSISKQGEKIESLELLQKKYDQMDKEFTDKEITRPEFWHALQIEAHNIEFLEFSENRFHKRTLYQKDSAGHWYSKLIQP